MKELIEKYKEFKIYATEENKKRSVEMMRLREKTGELWQPILIRLDLDDFMKWLEECINTPYKI